MSYRVTYAPPADDTLAKMSDGPAFREAMRRTIGSDPYGHGSIGVAGERDRREATVRGAIVLYYVSGSVLTVTVVRLIPVM
ncbi:hypothetical protein GCM10010145_28350 [Streptomyces ruber]|uniref:Uncharacterized protein n=2 Tax=Streptomyces TaxID=1883 RepID=A0A918BCL1_9ACTN|nr:hypothetical protein [Streptomyces ruber]GGQ56621.1 hypothetical protein GCM10010145_28350 [Streptomyces ruber]